MIKLKVSLYKKYRLCCTTRVCTNTCKCLLHGLWMWHDMNEASQTGSKSVILKYVPVSTSIIVFLWSFQLRLIAFSVPYFPLHLSFHSTPCFCLDCIWCLTSDITWCTDPTWIGRGSDGGQYPLAFKIGSSRFFYNIAGGLVASLSGIFQNCSHWAMYLHKLHLTSFTIAPQIRFFYWMKSQTSASAATFVSHPSHETLAASVPQERTPIK